MSETYTKTKITYESLSDIKLRIAKVAFELAEKGASLRLLAACYSTANYATVYKLLIQKGVGLVPGTRGGATKADQALVMEWREQYPELAEQFDKHQISPRRWCLYYGLEDENGDADLRALLKPNSYQDETGIDVYRMLREDFPSAFDDYCPPFYRTAEIDPDLYYRLFIGFVAGRKMYSFRQGLLQISVSNKSETYAYQIFRMRLNAEIGWYRMCYISHLLSRYSEELKFDAASPLCQDSCHLPFPN